MACDKQEHFWFFDKPVSIVKVPKVAAQRSYQEDLLQKINKCKS